MTTTIVPIEHPGRERRGLLLRRGARLGEATPLPGRSRESYEDVLAAASLGASEVPAALELARWSLEASFGTSRIVSQVLLDDPTRAVASARAAIERGARAFKLKLRRDTDAAVLGELRALGPELRLRVDANRAFPTADEVPWDALARAGVEWIEEPCPDAHVLRAAPVAIALDESVVDDAASALDAIASGRARALVLKPTLLGATAALELGVACLRRGGKVVVSHAFESEVGRRAAEEIARRLDPHGIHGLARWDGIDGYRLSASGAPVATLLDGDPLGADRIVG